MLEQLVPDALWTVLAPLLPPPPPRPKGGRPRLCDRAVLAGLVYILTTGIQWRFFPSSLGLGSASTLKRRLRQWQATGVWADLHHTLLERLAAAGKLDWSRCSLDSASLPAPLGGDQTGPNPTDRGKKGTKRHLLVDRRGVPLAVLLSGANRNDSKLLEPLLDAVKPIRNGKPGRPRRRPKKLHADKGYDFKFCRTALERRGIVPRIARRGIEPKDRLGRHRWVVERTLSWLGRFRRLVVRYERRAALHLAFTVLACVLVCWRRLAERY